jgi:hypothetical protein
MFSQYTVNSVRSGGINPKYAFFKFLQSIILVLYYLFPGCYSFRSAYSLFPAPYAISENQKQIGKFASFGYDNRDLTLVVIEKRNFFIV